MDYKEAKALRKLLKKGGFFIQLDNDSFGVYPSPPPEYDWTNASEEEEIAYEEWSDSGTWYHSRPEELLRILIDLADGSSEYV